MRRPRLLHGSCPRRVVSPKACCFGLLLGLTLLLTSTSTSAQSLDAIFAEGREAYLAGRFEDAVAAWERLREAGVRDADVEYDLGLAQVQLDRLGAASLSFERALEVDPGDDEARAALESARAVLAERRAEREGSASLGGETSFGEVLVRPFPESLLAWLLIGLEALLLLLLIALARLPRLRASLAIAAAVTGVLFVAVGAGLLVKRRIFQEGRRGIVLVEESTLREGPDERTARRAVTREGDEVRVLDEEEEWLLVEHRGRRGWAARDRVGLLD